MPAPPGMGQSGTTAGGTNSGVGSAGPGSGGGIGPGTYGGGGDFGYGGSEGRGGHIGRGETAGSTASTSAPDTAGHGVLSGLFDKSDETPLRTGLSFLDNNISEQDLMFAMPRMAHPLIGLGMTITQALQGITGDAGTPVDPRGHIPGGDVGTPWENRGNGLMPSEGAEEKAGNEPWRIHTPAHRPGIDPPRYRRYMPDQAA